MKKTKPKILTQILNAKASETINKEFFHKLTEQLLQKFYPKYCDTCNTLMTSKIKTRDYSIRCSKCFSQKSRLSYTPLHHFRLPMWMFGWVFYETFHRHPNVLTGAEISRRLGISPNSALRLKRRLQLFKSHQDEKIQKLILKELTEEFKNFNLPTKRDTDLTYILNPNKKPEEKVIKIDKAKTVKEEKQNTSNNNQNLNKNGSNNQNLDKNNRTIKTLKIKKTLINKDKNVKTIESKKNNKTENLEGLQTPVNIDTMAMFSASQRANKGRSRRKHTGLTASIYMSDKLGGKQIGSLFQCIARKKGWVIFKSIGTNQAKELRPILNKYIPERTVVFSDEGYKWYSNPNHRMVNHSAKSKYKKYRFARNRWSKNGIHSQAGESIQGSFKTAMRNYRYFKPANSQLYANEWTFMKNIKYFGIDALVEISKEQRWEGENFDGFFSTVLQTSAVGKNPLKLSSIE